MPERTHKINSVKARVKTLIPATESLDPRRVSEGVSEGVFEGP